MSYSDWKYMYTLYIDVHTVQLYFFITTIPDLSQSKAQKNFFSLKGFSEVGTGVIRGSSQACASQYAIRSAAAFDTFILQKLASIFSCSTSFLAWPTLMVLFTGVSPFIPYYIPLQVQSSPLFSLFFPLSFSASLVSLCQLMVGGMSVAGPHPSQTTAWMVPCSVQSNALQFCHNEG